MPVGEVVATNLKRLREHRGLSLARLASASGVSKTTLSQIELGNGNPTIGTIEALAESLSVEVSELLNPVDPGPLLRVVPRGAGAEISGAGATGNLVEASSVGGANLEFHRLELGPGSTESSASHGVGAQEHVFVARGRLVVVVDSERAELESGDYASFPSDRIHVWSNPGAETTEFWVAVTLPSHR